MGMRCEEPGWILCAMHDPTGRRGLWYRCSEGESPHVPKVIEICAGREGDDAYVRLELGAALSPEDMWQLEEALQRASKTRYG